jgi:hypothetical protein
MAKPIAQPFLPQPALAAVPVGFPALPPTVQVPAAVDANIVCQAHRLSKAVSALRGSCCFHPLSNCSSLKLAATDLTNGNSFTATEEADSLAYEHKAISARDGECRPHSKGSSAAHR